MSAPGAGTGGAGGPEIRTPRLLLRRWRRSDIEPFAAINADPVVMEFFPERQSREVSEAMIADFEQEFDRRGFGPWVVEIPGEMPFAGFVGLIAVAADIPCAPGVEVGWRLAADAWGRGIATEAARAAIDFGFRTARLGEIVAYTAAANVRSQRLMQRLGMHRDPAEDFDHPRVPAGRLRPHVLYRLTAPGDR